MRNVNKLSTIVLWVSMIITGVVFGVFYFRISKEQSPDVGAILYWLYIILTVCILAVAVSAGANIVQRWKTNRRSLIPSFVGMACMLAILAVSFLLGKRSSDGSNDIYSLIADVSIYSLYILLGLTCIAVFAGIIWSYIKRTR